MPTVRPGASRQSLRLRYKAIGLAAVIVLATAGLGWLIGDQSGSQSSATAEGSRAYTSDDRQACRDGGAALRAIGDSLTGGSFDTESDRADRQAAELTAAGRMQGAASQADSSRVSRALSDGADLIRQAARALDSDETDRIEQESDATFGKIEIVCGRVLAAG